MPGTLQAFLARATQKASEDLIAALDRVPADNRSWSAMGDARTALDQISECALLNGSTADLIAVRKWTMGDDFSEYMAARAKLATDEAAARSLLVENTARAIAAIETIPDADLDIQVDMPWGPLSLAQVASYPYWNMCYHEGQINYIASMLGCLN